ncbi:MAG: sodium ion-translocating decarboxylase subunit beta [Enterococcus sp.]|nr:sodium ion-translocating decarboxylase subunit beta [Enterococcus sp.]
MEMSLVATLFPGIASLFVQDPVIACARIFMIIFGFILAYLGFKRTLEPLIMVPMGVGMICINCGVLFLDGGKLGTLFLDPLVSEPGALMNIMQINFLQPIYNLTFSNSLVACLVFMGIGAMCEIGFILANPWTSIIIAIFAEAGTFVTLILGVNLGLTPPEAAAVASIGGADGPMVLFTSLMLAPELFVPISVIAYLYLSLTYAGYPTLVKMLVPKKYRGIDIIFDAPEIPKTKKFIFILVCCALLCILLPMAAPLSKQTNWKQCSTTSTNCPASEPQVCLKQEQASAAVTLRSLLLIKKLSKLFYMPITTAANTAAVTATAFRLPLTNPGVLAIN